MAGTLKDRRIEGEDALPRVLLGRLKWVLDVPPRAGLRLVEQSPFEVLLVDVDARLEQALAVDAGPRRVRSNERVANVQEDDFGARRESIGHARQCIDAPFCGRRRD